MPTLSGRHCRFTSLPAPHQVVYKAGTMADSLGEPQTPSRFSRAFKRLSLKTARVDPAPLAGVEEEALGEQAFTAEANDDAKTSRFSMSFLRPPSQLSTFSSSFSGRPAKKTKQTGLNLNSKVDLKLHGSNDDGVYRPGDTMRGQVMLDARDMEGRLLRSVKVRLEGRAKMYVFLQLLVLESCR